MISQQWHKKSLGAADLILFNLFQTHFTSWPFYLKPDAATVSSVTLVKKKKLKLKPNFLSKQLVHKWCFNQLSNSQQQLDKRSKWFIRVEKYEKRFLKTGLKTNLDPWGKVGFSTVQCQWWSWVSLSFLFLFFKPHALHSCSMATKNIWPEWHATYTRLVFEYLVLILSG